MFFVLSGFVLTLPLLNGRRFDWMAYYPRRIVRIGMPVICSIVFASALALLVAQHPEHARTSWVAATSVFPVTIDRFLANVDPMTGDYALNNPLWSIYWEVAFSMMLALFAGIALVVGIGVVREAPREREHEKAPGAVAVVVANGRAAQDVFPAGRGPAAGQSRGEGHDLGGTGGEPRRARDVADRGGAIAAERRRAPSEAGANLPAEVHVLGPAQLVHVLGGDVAVADALDADPRVGEGAIGGEDRRRLRAEHLGLGASASHRPSRDDDHAAPL